MIRALHAIDGGDLLHKVYDEGAQNSSPAKPGQVGWLAMTQNKGLVCSL
jgi:hypothetical protein